jgi:hypothetical protein
MDVLISPQGLPGASGIVGDLAWNTGAALLGAQENLGGFYISKPFTANAVASGAIAQSAPTVDAAFMIMSYVGGATTQIGSVTFSAGSNVGVISFLPGLSLIAQGSVIGLIAPSTPDATLALVSITVASL